MLIIALLGCKSSRPAFEGLHEALRLAGGRVDGAGEGSAQRVGLTATTAATSRRSTLLRTVNITAAVVVVVVIVATAAVKQEEEVLSEGAQGDPAGELSAALLEGPRR